MELTTYSNSGFTANLSRNVRSACTHGKVTVSPPPQAPLATTGVPSLWSQHQHSKRYRIWSFRTSPYLLNVMFVTSLLGSTSALWALARRHRDAATGYGPPSLHGIPGFGDFSLGHSASGRFSGHIVIGPLPNSLTYRHQCACTAGLEAQFCIA